MDEPTGHLIESVIVRGDLSALSPAERTEYYVRVCESVGVNPLTRPFEYLRLNGKEVLYATRTCTDQLRERHGVSVRIMERATSQGVYTVIAQATNKHGRIDESTGSVMIDGLKGDALANALMRCETKAKRRVTLSICGLGMLDESELDTVANAVLGPPADVHMPVLPSAYDIAQTTSHVAESQARVRNEADDLAREWASMLACVKNAKELETFIHFQGYGIRTMHTNAKSRMWRLIRKKCEDIGYDSREASDRINAAPDFPDDHEDSSES